VTAAVVLAGLRYGDRTLTWLDAVCLTLVAVGFALWLGLAIPGIAVFAACVIDFIGLVPTLVHAWRRPAEETAITYGLIAAAAGVATAAAWGTWTITAIAYPIYVLVSMTACWMIIFVRHRIGSEAVDGAGSGTAASDDENHTEAVGRPG
jgi:hypothetical protein